MNARQAAVLALYLAACGSAWVQLPAETPAPSTAVDAALGSPDATPVIDTDGDGMVDERDRCPTYPEDHDGFADDDGCPDPDNDRDGVLDVADACPLEPEAPGDDADGCPGPPRKLWGHGQVEFPQQVYFARGETDISARWAPVLDDVVELLEHNPRIRLRIEGHTDGLGAEAVDRRVSQARADAVKRYLVGAGVVAARLEAVGLGRTRPVARGLTAESRALNRRVDFTVIAR